jgi:hypothetical protein
MREAKTGEWQRYGSVERSSMIRVHHRVGRRTWVSTPLWLALIGYLFVGAAIAAVAVVALAIVAAVALTLLLVALPAAVVGWVRRRRRG